jgi:arylformamidase
LVITWTVPGFCYKLASREQSQELIMRVIDLSQVIEENMPVYPGTAQPVLDAACTVESCGFYERRLVVWSHTGTHMDAPAHILADGAMLDQMPAQSFVGRGCVVDTREFAGQEVSLEYLKEHGEIIKQADFMLLRTGWDAHWGKDAYYSGYAVLSNQAAKWLAGLGLKGMGMDCISPDGPEPTDYQVHKTLFAAGMVMIENLCKLDQLPQAGFWFSCLPLKLKDADGSPLRAVAMIG